MSCLPDVSLRRPLHRRQAQQSQEPLQQKHRGEDEGRGATLLDCVHLLLNACVFMQRKEAVGEDESLPEAAQDLEALTAETLSVRLSDASSQDVCLLLF